MEKKANKKKFRLVSLRFKTVAIIIFIALILSAIAVTISYRVYSSTMDEHYKTLTSNLAKTAASQLDAEDLLRYYKAVKQIGTYDDEKYNTDEAYRAEYDEKAEALKDGRYFELLEILNEIKDSNGIEYLYVQKLDGDYITYLFDTDESEYNCQLGVTHEIDSSVKELEHPEYGIPVYIGHYESEWLCSAGEPVYDDDG
ncbi:MAG: hypothetical protein IJQ80_06675, partial [Clostridia bacterium]|nr:hypothetical protein [Clostridia bacterium]